MSKQEMKEMKQVVYPLTSEEFLQTEKITSQMYLTLSMKLMSR